VYASKTRKEKFSGRGENCQRNVTDLAGSLVTSCRPPGRQQNTPDDRTWNAGAAVRTADGSRRTADAGDKQCLRCGCSSPSCTAVLCAADVDGPFVRSWRKLGLKLFVSAAGFKDVVDLVCFERR